MFFVPVLLSIFQRFAHKTPGKGVDEPRFKFSGFQEVGETITCIRTQHQLEWAVFKPIDDRGQTIDPIFVFTSDLCDAAEFQNFRREPICHLPRAEVFKAYALFKLRQVENGHQPKVIEM